MTVHRELTRQIAQDAARRVAERTVRHLNKLPGGLSGDDSGLRTAWEEFCVQVQAEESFFWEAYVETVKQTISGALRNVRYLELVALWLASDGAWEMLNNSTVETFLSIKSKTYLCQAVKNANCSAFPL